MPPRAIVEIRFGPLQGKKVCLDVGEHLCVGRTDFAQWVVPHDTQMSARHFELAWDGKQCVVRDLESAKGTLLAGKLIREAIVKHGGWIRAGNTDFLVHFEGHIPPRANDDETDEKTRQAAERALHALRNEATGRRLYALVDAGRDERILQVLRQNVEPSRSLYEGLEGETLAEVAPYLAGPLHQDSRLLEALVREGWGRRWGMYCTSEHALKEVRRHFRRFLMVEREDTGQRMYFRFYDPAVMRSFWATCTRRQKEEWLFDVHDFFVESETGDLERLTLSEHR